MAVDYKTFLWNQYGAALDMLEDAIQLCPDHLWTMALWQDDEDARYGQFWFVAYHTIFWSNLFLTGKREDFLPPPPFVRGRLPEDPYPKEQVLSYLSQCRRKCRATLDGLTDERAQATCVFSWMEPSFLELQMYAMRHVQEHAAQLSLALGQQGVAGFDWVATARPATA